MPPRRGRRGGGTGAQGAWIAAERAQCKKDRPLIKVIADLLIKNGLLVDPLRETAEKTDLSVKDGKILSFSRAEAREVIDAAGSFVSCGFIESHLHVEGLHLLPDHFFEAFLRHGTTTIITDLHEIANAGGMAGLLWYLSRIDHVPLDLFVMAPSCVPSSPYELGAAKLGVGELRRLRGMRRVLGLGEVMDVEAVVARRKGVMGKIALFEGRPVDGHAPGLTGARLDLYMSAGIHSDHETTSLEEGEEKLRRGMHLFLREGSVAKDLEALLPLVRPGTLGNLSLCTDDLSARDLHETGHLDRLVARLVRSGISPFRALSLVTRTPALYFNLNDRNAPALGRKADLVLFDDPVHMRILATVKAGKVVSREGEGTGAGARGARGSLPPRRGLKLAPLRKEDLRRRAKGENIRVMAVREETILVEEVNAKARIEEGYLACDRERDIIFAYVFDRYRAETTYGFGFVTGFSLRHGALGTTYAHDSHNLVILGDNPEDIYGVRELLRACGGGMAASRKGSALAVPLPCFGIISDLEAQAFLKKEAELDRLVRKMGVGLKNPFFQMSFLSLPVIPQVRLTTKGLFHVGTARYVESNY